MPEVRAGVPALAAPAVSLRPEALGAVHSLVHGRPARMAQAMIPGEEATHPNRARRLDLGLSVAEVARKMRVTWVTVHRWETLRTTPDRLTLREWDRVLRLAEKR